MVLFGAAVLFGTASCTYDFDDYEEAPESGVGGVSGSGGTGATGGGGSGGTGGSVNTLDCDPLSPSDPDDEEDYVACASGEQCALQSNGTFRCVPRDGNGGDNAPCDMDTDCRAGYACIDLVCREMCDVDDSECADDQVCSELDLTSNDTELGACLTPCDPKAPNCGSDTQCIFDSLGNPSCHGSAGRGTQYDVCGSDADCAPGFTCQGVGFVDPDAEEPVLVRQCLSWATDDSDCDAPDTVRGLRSVPIYDGTEYGVCFSDCDPSDPAGGDEFRSCEAGERCSFLGSSEGEWFITTCEAEGAQSLDDYCSVEASCGGALACAAINDIAVCSEYCWVGDAAGCPDGRSCSPFPVPRTLGEDEFGYCHADTYCHPVAADSCPNEQRCTVLTTDYAVCKEPTDSLAAGDPCDSIDACLPGLTCVGSANWGYVCTESCAVAAAATDCSDGSACQPFATPVSVDAVEYGFCSAPRCNPFPSASPSLPPAHPCPSGSSCGFIGTDGVRCKEPGTQALGDTCEYSYDCEDGLVCVFFTDAAVCQQACRPGLSGDADCTLGGICYSFADEPSTIDNVEIGYCE